jgi:hypothetical protein
MFDQEGHVQTTPTQLLAAMRANLDYAVKELALTGTPRVFNTFHQYRLLVEAVGDRIGVHPRTIVVRGSAQFGFSTTPQPHRVWQPFRYNAVAPDAPSDIDLAVVDFRYFSEMNREIQGWEAAQRRPKPNEPGAWFWLQREQRRHFGICADGETMPPNTCVAHVNAMTALSATAFCQGPPRKISAFVYRDWWCLHNKCAFDLGQVRDLGASGALRIP